MSTATRFGCVVISSTCFGGGDLVQGEGLRSAAVAAAKEWAEAQGKLEHGTVVVVQVSWYHVRLRRKEDACMLTLQG